MTRSIKRDVFDFELGYLKRSPCVSCENRDRIPYCFEECHLLDELQVFLARGISTQSSSFKK